MQNIQSIGFNSIFDLSPFQKTALTAGALLAGWYIADPTSLLKKIGVVAFGTLVAQAENWIPCLKRQLELTQIGKHEIKTWNEEYNYFVKSVKNDSKKVTWDTAQEYRDPVLPAAKNLIQQIVSKHLSNNAKILEIGSNILDKNGFSYLAKLLPNSFLKELTYSDLPARAKQEAPKTKRCYKCLDITNPGKEFFNSQDCIMAINVADVLSRHDLSKMALGAHQILKSGGYVILLADRPIEITPLFEKLSNTTDFVFPWTEAISLGECEATLIKGAKVASVDSMRKIIESWGDEHKTFYNKLLDLEPEQRCDFLQGSFFKGLHLSQFLEFIADTQCQSIEREKSYKEDVVSAFKDNHFKTVSAGYMEGKKISHHPDQHFKKTDGSPYNELIYDPRNGGPLIAKGNTSHIMQMMQLTSVFHVMIFEKV